MGMHAVGLHSALAIKRQRKRRDEQRRAKERRYSSQSGESGLTSPRQSTTSLDKNSRRYNRGRSRRVRKDVDSQIGGVLHIGVVFLILGVFLLLSSFFQYDFTTWKDFRFKDFWNDLMALGLIFIGLGLFLLVLNRMMSKKEEQDLERYVQAQLTRSKSGHRLEVDSETGGLTTKHAKRSKLMNVDADSKVFDDPEEDLTNVTCTSPLEKNYSNKNGTNNGSNIILENIMEEDPKYAIISEYMQDTKEKPIKNNHRSGHIIA